MFPRAALTPPCAATVWDLVGNSFVMQAVLKPASASPKAARRPAPPAPTTMASYSWSITGYLPVTTDWKKPHIYCQNVALLSVSCPEMLTGASFARRGWLAITLLRRAVECRLRARTLPAVSYRYPIGVSCSIQTFPSTSIVSFPARDSLTW